MSDVPNVASDAACPVVSWVDDDGRAISAATKEAAVRDGGASKSATAAYSRAAVLRSDHLAAMADQVALVCG